MSYQQDRFREIADKIREYTDTSEPIVPKTFALKIDDVAMVQFQKGKDEGGGGETLPDADVMEFPLADGGIGRVSTDSKYYDDIATLLINTPDGISNPIKPSEMYGEINRAMSNAHNTGYANGFTEGEAQGKQTGREEFMRLYQGSAVYSNSGASRLFSGVGWNDDTFFPVIDIDMSGQNVFNYFAWGQDDKTVDLTQRLEDCGVKLDFTKGLGTVAFGYAWVTTVPKIIISSYNGLVQTFRGAKPLVTIEELALPQDNDFVYDRTFESCINLINLKITGTIGGSGFNIHWSTKLSRNSILSVLQACNKANAGVAITLPAKCIDGTTVTETYIANDTELNTALTNATTKGYTVSFA